MNPSLPRDPTTGRFLPRHQDGCEDGAVEMPATERARAADFGRRDDLTGSWIGFVRMDEVSDEMAFGDADFALSPEDELLAREEDGYEDCDDGDDDDEFVCIDDSLEAVGSVDDDHVYDDYDEYDEADMFRDRPTVLPGKHKKHNSKCFSKQDTPERRRRQKLIGRMRRARRAAQTWLDKPDWSDVASQLLELERLFEEKDEKLMAEGVEWWNPFAPFEDYFLGNHFTLEEIARWLPEEIDDLRAELAA